MKILSAHLAAGLCSVSLAVAAPADQPARVIPRPQVEDYGNGLVGLGERGAEFNVSLKSVKSTESAALRCGLSLLFKRLELLGASSPAVRETPGEAQLVITKSSAKEFLRTLRSSGAGEDLNGKRLDQAYTLVSRPASPNGSVVQVTGCSDLGIYYALVSLCQLLDKDERGAITVPVVKLADWPEIGLRLSKTSASTLSLPKLREYAAWLPLYKMNVMGLQFHGKNSNQTDAFRTNVSAICSWARQSGVLETVVYFCPFRGKAYDFNTAADEQRYAQFLQWMLAQGANGIEVDYNDWPGRDTPIENVLNLACRAVAEKNPHAYILYCPPNRGTSQYRGPASAEMTRILSQVPTNVWPLWTGPATLIDKPLDPADVKAWTQTAGRRPFLWLNRVGPRDEHKRPFSRPVAEVPGAFVFRGEFLPTNLDELFEGVHFNSHAPSRSDPETLAYLATAADFVWNPRGWDAVDSCLRARRFVEVMLPLVSSQERLAVSESGKAPSDTRAPLIIPRPKAVCLGSGSFRLSSDTHWTLRAATRDERLWRAAESVFAGAPGIFEKSGDSWITLVQGVNGHTKFPAGPSQPRWAADPEGYRLAVEPDGLAITASTAQGAFYGLQTLAQLWQPGASGTSCPALEIEDWPALRFRGVHWFPSASGVPMHLRLITNVFSALKFNSSVIQCEAARWDTHPEITAPNAISKTDLHRLVEACRARCLEPIPLLNVPGHAEWVFRNGSNLDFAEDPQTPYAYCVNNPKSFAFMQDVLNECLPIFQSKFCHIGHDEVTMRGRFPNPECPRCKDATVTELVVKHVNFLTEWLNRQGIESMIWGDMLLGPGEAKDAAHAKTLEDAQQRRAGINRKTIIVDWHYVGSADARSIEILRRDGFRVIAASWYKPANIQHLAQAAISAGAEGLLQTTWMGYFPDERAMRSELQQFTAFVLAAEYAWSGREESPTELGYDPKDIFQKAYAGQR